MSDAPEIEALLGEHAYRGLGTSPGVAQLCACGFMSYKAGMDYPHTQDQHRAHVASVLEAHTVDLVRAAAEKALRDKYAEGWRELLHDKVVQDALIATAGLMETQRITPECRDNRTVDGAWDEAVRRLREIYDAQVAHDPTLTIGLSIGRIRRTDKEADRG